MDNYTPWHFKSSKLKGALLFSLLLATVTANAQDFGFQAVPHGTRTRKVRRTGEIRLGGLLSGPPEFAVATESQVVLMLPTVNPGEAGFRIDFRLGTLIPPGHEPASFGGGIGRLPLMFLDNQGDVWQRDPSTNLWKKRSNIEVSLSGQFVRFPSKRNVPSSIQNQSNQTFYKIDGFANFYAMSSAGFYGSRDTAGSWAFDTLGLNNAYLSDFAIDSSGYVYLATDKGLFRQHPDSSIWRFVDSLYYDNFGSVGFPNLRSVFVDRKNRILASPWYSPFMLYVSSNGGTAWSRSTPGLSFGQFADDTFGNLYGIAGFGGRTNQLYRSSDSGATWVRIDSSITNRVKPSVPDQFFNSISGDTLLFAATAMGLFVSSNQGATWQELNAGVTDENPLGLVRLSSGRMVYSGTLGVFTREKNDTIWTKRHPVNVYQQFAGLSAGGAGNLFALAENRANQPGQQSPQLVIRSTDNGSTWQYDTSGIGKAEGQAWYVDENGTQHLATSKFGLNKPMIFSKTLGGSWSLDTAGFRTPATIEESRTFFSDKNGYIYVGGDFSTRIWRRPIGGGTWVPDTAGLGTGAAPIYMGAAGKNGTVYAASFTTQFVPSLYRRSSGAWSKVLLPADRNSHNINAISVDSSGALFVAFSDFFSLVGRGVYSTTNNGTTWQSHGLDSIPVVFTYLNAYGLVSFGDSTYVLTTGRGAYVLTRSSGPTAVESDAVTPESFALEQNYPNPFNPSTTIEFDLPSAAYVRIRIFDLLGREVASLVNEERSAGPHRVEWNASKLSSGVYFYRMEVGAFVGVRKLVLLK